MNTLAERYVKAVLALGQHDADYVDAFYGPAEWRKEAEASKVDLETLAARAAAIRAGLKAAPPSTDELSRLRWQYLDRQLSSMQARIRMLKGERLSFDDESKALYDAVAPTHPVSRFQAIIDTLDKRFPGNGSLAVRYDAWRKPFAIPRDKLDAVFQTAIGACRERTAKHITLPADERFTVEYVTNKSWSGYNWYQGDYRSVIQVNTDLPIYIDRAIDLACHEGYPGHHVYNALLEKHLVRDRGWIEFARLPALLAAIAHRRRDRELRHRGGVSRAGAGRLRADGALSRRRPRCRSRHGGYYDVQALVDQLVVRGQRGGAPVPRRQDFGGRCRGVAREVRAVCARSGRSSACGSSISTAAT